MSRDLSAQRAASGAELAAKLAVVREMPAVDLRAEWRRLYRAHPPKRVARALLALGVAWKIQEQAYGGLDATTKRRLAALASTLERDGDVKRNRVARLKPGAKLVRAWRGEIHKVTVLEDGYEWKGTQWRSLSVIAREITGVHWSGPRFFGLNGKAQSPVSSEVEETGDA